MNNRKNKKEVLNMNNFFMHPHDRIKAYALDLYSETDEYGMDVDTESYNFSWKLRYSYILFDTIEFSNTIVVTLLLGHALELL